MFVGWLTGFEWFSLSEEVVTNLGSVNAHGIGTKLGAESTKVGRAMNPSLAVEVQVLV